MSDENDNQLKKLRRKIQEGFDSGHVEFDFKKLNRELDRKPGRFKGQLEVSDDFDVPSADAYVGLMLDNIERHLIDEMLNRHMFAADLARIEVLYGLLCCDSLEISNDTSRRLTEFDAVFMSLHLGITAGDVNLTIARDWLAARAVDVVRLCRALHGGGRAEDLAALLLSGG